MGITLQQDGYNKESGHDDDDVCCLCQLINQWMCYDDVAWTN